MGIRFECPNGHKLHVKSFLAGKKGLCPECGAGIVIPGGTGDQGNSGKVNPATPTVASPAASATPSATPPPAVSPTTPPPVVQQTTPPVADVPPLPQDAVWFVRSPSGDQYGPANQAVFDEWVQQGRIGSASLVWRDGWPDWRKAAEVIDTTRQSVKAHDAPSGNGRIPAIANSSAPANTLTDKSAIQIETDRPIARSSSRTPIVVVLLCLACAILLIPLVWMLMGSG